MIEEALYGRLFFIPSKWRQWGKYVIVVALVADGR